MRRPQISNAVLTVLMLVLAAGVIPAHSQTFSVLYNFGSKSGDPSGPAYSGIIAQGRDGNLFTTAPTGGVNNFGAVFKITPAGTVTVVYSFDGTHGSDPFSGLTLGTDGNFYGTTYQGGTSLYGTVFKITPSGSLTVLHNFTNGNDGANPYAPPVQGTDGNWYGTTNAGGASGYGTVYKLTPSGTFTTLYSFDITHGWQPRDPLVLGTDGNLYGTTLYGGINEDGVVFKITNTGTLTVLYSFDNTHGELPTSPLIQAIDGNFYGTTEGGGSAGSGVVFKMTTSGTLTVLHNMNGTTDGLVPYAGLVQASDGNLYGVNGQFVSGGNSGTLFKTTTKGAFTVLHSFDGATGSTPQVTPFQHTNGILYGDTSSGGTGNVSPCSIGICGVFYKLNGTLPAFIRLLPYSGKVGSKIGILGQGFSSSSVVKFNGVTATTISRTGTTFIQATVPTGATDGYVTVTTGTTTLKSLRKFVVHNSWASGAPIPTAVEAPAVGFINGKVYVVGGATAATGSNLVGDNQVYNLSSNTWTTAAPIPTPVWASASAVVNGVLYVIGGYSSGGATNSVQAYNPTTNTWSTKAAMPTALGEIAAVVDNGSIYVMGGGLLSTGRANNVAKYNVSTNTWTKEAALLVGKSSPSTGLLGSTIVAADGYANSGDTGDNEAYNVSTNAWSSVTSDSTGRNASCFGVLSGQLYVAGGGDNGTPKTLTESFSLTTNKWTTQAAMPQAVIFPGSAVANGQLYCFGGANVDHGAGTIYTKLQIYQP